MIYKSYIIEEKIETLKEKIALFYGENIGLKNFLKKKLKQENKDADILLFNQDEILQNKNLLLNEVSNISLFNKKKIIFIENTSDKILSAIEEVVDILETQKVFLFSNILDKRSKLRNFFEKSKSCGVVACYEDNEISIKKIVLQELKDFTGLNAENLNLIIEKCNLDRAKLYNELAKIHTFFQNKILEKEKLEILLDVKVNEDFDRLKDEALIGNNNETNKLLSDTFIDPEKNIFYLNSINNRLCRLLEVQQNQGKSIEKAINELKPPVFWKDKTIFTKQAKKWSSLKIHSLLQNTYKLEVDIKSNLLIDKKILIKKLIIDICKLANAS